MRRMAANIYASIFSRPIFYRLNNSVLSAALRARGYNNFRNDKESGERFFIEKILSSHNPKLCIDIGANIGNYTKQLLKKTDAVVISFEPLPNAYERLKSEVAKYEDRAITVNKGVGNENKTHTIHYNPDDLAHASFSEDVDKVSYVTNKMTAEVPMETLDSYCRRNSISEIDFIKIDVEGFEPEVFNGAVDTFLNVQPKFIQLEFNWHHLFRNMTLYNFSEFLPNYDVYQLIPNNWIKIDPRDPLSNIFRFSNFVFVRH